MQFPRKFLLKSDEIGDPGLFIDKKTIYRRCYGGRAAPAFRKQSQRIEKHLQSKATSQFCGTLPQEIVGEELRVGSIDKRTYVVGMELNGVFPSQVLPLDLTFVRSGCYTHDSRVGPVAGGTGDHSDAAEDGQGKGPSEGHGCRCHGSFWSRRAAKGGGRSEDGRHLAGARRSRGCAEEDASIDNEHPRSTPRPYAAIGFPKHRLTYLPLCMEDIAKAF
ncbi:hypothetical protein CDAR_449181 [Caerostris darwini]|uniref:Uncharacterized protein n=1 Tax=Caerostris darwini TaxID=1538125 RepID=A0AAV4QV24_9ARAC|nr:hypothetical protein CDAR_449181 [Caerostris darwini]